MEEKLFYLIMKPKYKNIFINERFIDECIDIITEYRELKDYVKDIVIEDEYKGEKLTFSDSIINAIYNQHNQKLYLYKDGLNKSLNIFKSRYHSVYNSIETVVFPHIFLALILLHELEHAAQIKLMDNDIKSLEAKLLQISTCYMNIEKAKNMLKEKGLDMAYLLIPLYKQERRNKIYNCHRELSLEERLAELRSHNTMLSVLQMAPHINKNIIALIDAFLKYHCLNGYEKGENGIITSPTISYINLGMEDDLSIFDWYDENPSICLRKLKKQLSLEDRLKYGLYIDKKEYNNIQKQYKIR